MAHTPGPYWMAADRNPADGTDRLVFDVGVGDSCLATFDCREDALLYRASPELLDALVLALPYVECAADDPGYKAGAVAKMVKQIRKAIARAEGAEDFT